MLTVMCGDLNYLQKLFAAHMQEGDCNILICDETGDSLSPAVLACILLVRYQVYALHLLCC